MAGPFRGCAFPRILLQAMEMLNNRPRQILNYRTPAEVLSKIPGVAVQN
jgi:IS30 family transposase